MVYSKTRCVSIYIQEYKQTVCINIPWSLTEMELLLLCQLLTGKSLSEIARYRNCSLKTLSCQKKKLYNKLGIMSVLTLWRDMYFRKYISALPEM